MLNLTPSKGKQLLLMDRAYAGKNIREVAYKKRNEIERFFRRIKRFRRIFTRYDKLDVVYEGFILFAMVIDSLV